MNKNSKKFQDYYKKKNVTGTYDSQREGNAYRRKKRALELEYFLGLLDKQPKEKVLELGCSSGFLTKHLKKVTAIDTCEEMLKIAKKKNPSATCIHADMFEMPFKDNSFDKVVTMRVWNHIDKDEFKKALKEVKRVLKEGGIFVFDMEDKSFLRRVVGFFYQKITRVTGFKIYQYNLKEIKGILKSEGFIIERGKFLPHRVGRQIIMRTRLIKK